MYFSGNRTFGNTRIWLAYYRVEPLTGEIHLINDPRPRATPRRVLKTSWRRLLDAIIPSMPKPILHSRPSFHAALSALGAALSTSNRSTFHFHFSNRAEGASTYRRMKKKDVSDVLINGAYAYHQYAELAQMVPRRRGLAKRAQKPWHRWDSFFLATVYFFFINILVCY